MLVNPAFIRVICGLFGRGFTRIPRENAKVQIISRKDQRELESSETTRQTLQRGEDIVRAAWRHAEVGRNDQSFNAS